MRLSRTLARCGLWISLAGCAAPDTVLPQHGPTMLELYDAHQRALGALDAAPAPRQPLTASSWADAAPFARLPNPDLWLYIPPHFAAGGLPVPGYHTLLPMYERIEYALPGEPDAARVQAF